MATVANLDDQLRRFVQCTAKVFTFEYPKVLACDAAGSITGRLYFDPHINAAEALL